MFAYEKCKVTIQGVCNKKVILLIEFLGVTLNVILKEVSGHPVCSITVY